MKYFEKISCLRRKTFFIQNKNQTPSESQLNGPFRSLRFYVLANLLSNCYTEIIHSHLLTCFAQTSTCLCL
jgi:hypothetical protein